MDTRIFIHTFVDPSRVFLSPSGKNKSSIAVKPYKYKHRRRYDKDTIKDSSLILHKVFRNILCSSSLVQLHRQWSIVLPDREPARSKRDERIYRARYQIDSTPKIRTITSLCVGNPSNCLLRTDKHLSAVSLFSCHDDRYRRWAMC